MSLHDNASLSVSKLYQTNFYRSIIFRIIIILVFIIVQYIPNYIRNKYKSEHYITNNNYYVRMYIDTKRDSHTFVWKSLYTTLNLNIYDSRYIGIYFIVYCFQKQILNRLRPQEYNPQSMSLRHTSIQE